MTKEFLHMQMLAGIITEGEYKAKLQENATKKPLNENFVGIGAINSPFAQREKTDYELAFEHFAKGSSILDERLSFMGTEEEPEIINKWEEMSSMNPRTTPDDIANMLGLDPNLVAATLNARLGKNYPLDPDWNQSGDDFGMEDDFDIKISEADTDTETETETEKETETERRRRRRNLDVDPDTDPLAPPKAMKESRRPSAGLTKKKSRL
jgi:hypothetical protein